MKTYEETVTPSKVDRLNMEFKNRLNYGNTGHDSYQNLLLLNSLSGNLTIKIKEQTILLFVRISHLALSLKEAKRHITVF
jgi:hypothetical protein